MISLPFFGLTLPTPFIVFIQAICPARAPSSVQFPEYGSMFTIVKMEDCWIESVTFKLTRLFPLLTVPFYPPKTIKIGTSLANLLKSVQGEY